MQLNCYIAGDTALANSAYEDIKNRFKDIHRVKNFYNDFVFASIAAFAEKSKISETSEKNWDVKQKVVIFDDDTNGDSIKGFCKSFITGLQVFERWEYSFHDPQNSFIFSKVKERIIVIWDVLIHNQDILTWIPAYRAKYIIRTTPL